MTDENKSIEEIRGKLLIPFMDSCICSQHCIDGVIEMFDQAFALAIQLERDRITFDSVVPTWVNEEPAWTLIAIKDGKVIWYSDNPVSKPEIEKLYYIATGKHAGMGGYGLSVSDVNTAAEQIYKESLSPSEEKSV